MLVLAFSIDRARFGIDVRDVVAVIPVPPLRRLDGAPAFVSGVLPVLGALLPVIDLCLLHVGRPCRRAYGTRIVVVRCAAPGRTPREIGLAAEDVTDVVEVDPARTHDPGVKQPDAPWLGVMGEDDVGDLLQIVAPDRLLDDQVWELLSGNG